MSVDLSTLNHFAKKLTLLMKLYLTLAQNRKRKEKTRNVFIECIGDTFCSCGISEPRRFDGEDRSS